METTLIAAPWILLPSSYSFKGGKSIKRRQKQPNNSLTNMSSIYFLNFPSGLKNAYYAYSPTIKIDLNILFISESIICDIGLKKMIQIDRLKANKTHTKPKEIE